MFGFILPFVIESSAKIFSTFIFAEFESSARNEGKFVLCQMLMGICLYKSELNQIGIFFRVFIEVSVLSQECERSCICVRGIIFCLFLRFFLLECGTVPIMRYIFFFHFMTQ